MMKASRITALIALLCLQLSLPGSPALAQHAGSGAGDSDMLYVTAEMTELAKAILDTVSEGPGGIEIAVGYNRQELLQLDFADAARTNYVYWPYLRKGLPLEFMTAQQKVLAHELLHTAMSAKGYLSAVQIMQLEKILSDNERIGFPRGPENYTLAIFGSPGEDTHWGWRFEGHHLSLNFTLAEGEISVTPAFMGASPALISTGSLAGVRSQHDVHNGGLELVHALNDSQRSQAIVDENPPFDILSGNLNRPPEDWDDWKSLPQTGIAVTSLSTEQKGLVQQLIDDVITNYRPEISRAYLEQIDINDLYFTWIGSTSEGEPHYWRLDGPDFFFEYDLVQDNGNHVHTVWRSKEGDFGADLLMEHRHNSH